MAYYIGLMSGTSVDAIDAAVVELTDAYPPRLIEHYSHPIPTQTQQQLITLNQRDNLAFNELGQLDNDLGHLFATATLALLDKAKIPPGMIEAIGSHGQTIHHAPDRSSPFTLQIGNAHIIAEKTGITTIADFRRRDMAAGGQGAPLVPAFHNAVFRSPEHERAVVNIGGIANITILPATPSETIRGFDTGPGNCLMDSWAHKHLGTPFDQDGSWAAKGRLNEALLRRLQSDHYFSIAAPKSSGREYFNLTWLEKYIKDETADDIQTTLCHLTAATISDAIRQYAPSSQEVYICGGGTRNLFLMQLLSEYCANRQIERSDKLGVAADWVEAMAFAWLARQTLLGRPGNIPSVTGARRSVPLGAIYPGQAAGKEKTPPPF